MCVCVCWSHLLHSMSVTLSLPSTSLRSWTDRSRLQAESSWAWTWTGKNGLYLDQATDPESETPCRDPNIDLDPDLNPDPHLKTKSKCPHINIKMLMLLVVMERNHKQARACARAPSVRH